MEMSGNSSNRISADHDRLVYWKTYSTGKWSSEFLSGSRYQ